jgi:hypothetical protein
MLFVFKYSWCPTQCLYHILSFNSNMTDVTSGAGIADLSVPMVLSLIRGVKSFVFFLCIALFVCFSYCVLHCLSVCLSV